MPYLTDPQGNQLIAPNPALSSFEDGPLGRERNILPPNFTMPLYSQAEVTTPTDRDSSVPPTEKKRGKQPQTSSYWRVNEMEMFPKYLQKHGKNWRKIAEEMGTKTAQQVSLRNMKLIAGQKLLLQECRHTWVE
jgi:hypothetical protein